MKAGPLKPGQVIVCLKGSFDFFGTITDALQGDTEAFHVCIVLPNGKIATTNAIDHIIYGEREAKSYLEGRTFFILQTIDPLTDEKLAIIQKCHENIMDSGIDRLYGIWKFPILECLGIIEGAVPKMGSEPKMTRPDFPICSQAVAYCLWNAGIKVGQALGKEDWTAVIPETFLVEAKETYYYRDRILLGERPAYNLETIEPFPFSGLA
jgi:hypothetical protein